jgi:hypothetical protein
MARLLAEARVVGAQDPPSGVQGGPAQIEGLLVPAQAARLTARLLAGRGATRWIGSAGAVGAWDRGRSGRGAPAGPRVGFQKFPTSIVIDSVMSMCGL